MSEWISLYRTLAAARLRGQAQYRWNFALTLGLQVLMYTSELAVVLIVVNQVGTVAGWDVPQMMLLYGMVNTEMGLYRVFATELYLFDKYLVNGEFDAVLTRPAPALLTLVARSFDLTRVGAAVEGAALVVAALIWLAPPDPVGAVAATALGILCGTVIWFSVVTATATLGFWTTRIDEMQPLFLYGPEVANSYPLSIYPHAVRVLFESVLPVAWGAYLPATVAIRGASPWLLAAGVAAACLSLLAAIAFWNTGVRHYTSTGN